jgi:2-polyprenyl-3-methyl-5-hydroxy-6-metoxy-1,4-benzoquinol methylase
VRDQSRLSNFISATAYTDPVDIKKLRFIYSAIERYAGSKGKEFEKLHVLEVACGKGGITFPLASLGCDVTAFDIDENAVEFLQAQVKNRRVGNVTVTVDNGYTFDDGKDYDIVVASEVFEHVLEPSRFAGNITRRMMEGSYLIVTTPNGYGPWEMKNRMDIRTRLRNWNALRHLLGKTPYIKGSGDGHCQVYTKRRLLNLFSTFSLGLIGSAKSDSLLTIFSQLRRSTLVGNLDIKLADILPYWLASGWYFIFELRGSNKFTAG